MLLHVAQCSRSNSNTHYIAPKYEGIRKIKFLLSDKHLHSGKEVTYIDLLDEDYVRQRRRQM